MDQDVDLSSSRARMPPVSQRKRKVPELELDGIEVRSFAPPAPPLSPVQLLKESEG
jgi:hypothetical protein